MCGSIRPLKKYIMMKDLLFKKILLVPFLVTGIFPLFLSSCDKYEDSEGKSLAVTVNFVGTTIPSVDDELMLALYYSPFSEIVLGTDFPADMLFHTLTADDITKGITLTFTDIDPTEKEVYILAFVDSDGDTNPEEGELIECYQDVNFVEALNGKANATNVAGEIAITINLDKILTMPSLDVTVNFTGDKVPSVDDELVLALYYSPLSEIGIDEPDDILYHTLTSDDITNGITLTLTDINPFAAEVYVVAFVDSGGNGPEVGELMECYKDVDVFEALFGETNATNVAGETEITINLDLVIRDVDRVTK
jgi:hypothetical protein